MRKRLVLMFASGFGAGLAPKASGTFGTFAGLLIAVLVADSIFLIAVVSVLGTWIAHEAEVLLGEHDSPRIVVDEIAGFLIAAYMLHGYYLVAAFVLFRAFDILKPFPINRLQKLPGGLGIMADDLAAGFLTNMVIRMAVYIFALPV